MSTITAWEPGLTCDAADCGAEFVIGEEIIYWYGRKLHLRCASADASARRAAAGEDDDVVMVARRQAEGGGRVTLTRRQLHELAARAAAAGVEPVRKPDSGRRQWYGRMSGWAAERVQAGLSAPEVAGLWLDFLEAGRMPPVRQRDLAAILGVISPLPLSRRYQTFPFPASRPQKDQETRHGGHGR